MQAVVFLPHLVADCSRFEWCWNVCNGPPDGAMLVVAVEHQMRKGTRLLGSANGCATLYPPPSPPNTLPLSNLHHRGWAGFQLLGGGSIQPSGSPPPPKGPQAVAGCVPPPPQAAGHGWGPRPPSGAPGHHAVQALCASRVRCEAVAHPRKPHRLLAASAGEGRA